MTSQLCDTMNLYIGEHLPFEALWPLVQHQLGKHASDDHVAEKAAELILERMVTLGILHSPVTDQGMELLPAARKLAEQGKFDHILRWCREGWDELEHSYFIERWPDDQGVQMGAQVFRWLRRNNYLRPLLDRLCPGETCAQLLQRVRELGHDPSDPNKLTAKDLHAAMEDWYFLRNPHNSAMALDSPGELRRWQCNACGQIAESYDTLCKTECSYVYPPCAACFKTPECAPDCPSILAILGDPKVHLTGSIETEGNN